jgi:hypothetical protein
MKKITDKQIIESKDESQIDLPSKRFRKKFEISQLANLKESNEEEFNKQVVEKDPKPSVKNFSHLMALQETNSLTKKDVYEVLKDLTPYLLRRLIYESYSASSSLNRIRAARAILDKILPNVQATDVQLSVEDQAQLVIVKASKDDDEDDD